MQLFCEAGQFHETPYDDGRIAAFLALYWRRLPLLRRGLEPGAGLTAPVQRFQSGVVNDYVTWIVLGLAGIGGVLALIIR